MYLDKDTENLCSVHFLQHSDEALEACNWTLLAIPLVLGMYSTEQW